MPKNALGLMDLSSGQVARIERVKSFQVPEDGSGFIAYLLEPKPDQKKPEGGSPSASAAGGNPTVREGATSAEGSAAQKAASASKEAGGNPTVREGVTSGEGSAPQKAASASKEKKKEYGSDLVLRNTVTGVQRTFNDVLDYSLSKDGKTLVYTVASKKEETNGVYVVTPQTETAPVSILAGKGKYQKLTWDEDQTELAFISDHDDAEAKQPKLKVCLWDRGGSPTPGSPYGQPSRGRAVRESSDRNHATLTTPNAASEVVSTSSPGFRK